LKEGRRQDLQNEFDAARREKEELMAEIEAPVFNRRTHFPTADGARAIHGLTKSSMKDMAKQFVAHGFKLLTSSSKEGNVSGQNNEADGQCEADEEKTIMDWRHEPYRPMQKADAERRREQPMIDPKLRVAADLQKYQTFAGYEKEERTFQHDQKLSEMEQVLAKAKKERELAARRLEQMDRQAKNRTRVGAVK